MRSAGLRLACVVSLLITLAGCGKSELYTDLREREANEMLGLLLRAHIAAEKVPVKGGTITLMVDKDRLPDAISLLNAAGLPREQFANMGDLFKREGLISSPSEERVRYIYGITQELSRTLTGIEGVLSARVHVVLPNNDPAEQPTAKPASAAVMIRYAPGAAIEAAVPKIKELVVNSIEGLTYDHVSVILVRADQDNAAPADLAAATAQEPPAPLGLPMPVTLYVGLGGLALSLLLNVALGVLLLVRRRRGQSAQALVPAE